MKIFKLRVLMLVMVFMLIFTMNMGINPVMAAVSGTPRYLVFGEYNFMVDATGYSNALSRCKTFVDQALAIGFNVVRIHIPWWIVEPTQGTFDFSLFDQELDYIINQKNSKVALMIDLSRFNNDGFLPESELQRDYNGNKAIMTWDTGVSRTNISFASDLAVSRAANVVNQIVTHYKNRYPNYLDKILYIEPTFSMYTETEYSNMNFYDYSAPAIAKFKSWVSSKYKSINVLNSIWGTSYASFNDIQPPSTGYYTGSSSVDWYQFRSAVLKNLIDTLANTIHSVAPGLKCLAQFGHVSDGTSGQGYRGTLCFPYLTQNVDIVEVDDDYTYNHGFSMDLLRASLPDKMIANECYPPMTPVQYAYDFFAQCYDHGANIMTTSGLDSDDISSSLLFDPSYQQVFSRIAADYLSSPVPTGNSQGRIMYMSAKDVYTNGNSDFYQSSYNTMSNNGALWCDVILEDDLTYNSNLISLGATATASTSYSDPSLAVDGNSTTYWAASSGAFPQWLKVDLGFSINLSQINTAFYSNDNWKYKIEGSNNNLTWELLVDKTSAGVMGRDMLDNVSGFYRYIRITVTGTEGNWAAIREFKVHKGSWTLSAGYSGVQGQDNWYYQYCDTVSLQNSNMTWDHDLWGGTYKDLNTPYLFIGSGWSEPDGHKETVLKWVAPRNGTVNITGLAKLQYNNLIGQDGVYVKIQKSNGTILKQYTLLASDNTVGIDCSVLNVPVTGGEYISFIVNQKGNGYYDVTYWDPSITYTN